MKKALIGYGGFAREIKAHMDCPTLICFVDDEYYKNEPYTLPLSKFNPNEYKVLIAIGNPMDRYKVQQRLPKNTKYFSYIDDSALILDENVYIGEGSIICAGCILTTNIKIGNHCHLNLLTTVGHDTNIGDFFTSAPGVKISGNCNIGNNVYFGTNATIREKLTVTDNTIIGLNAGVVKNITEAGIYVGTPAIKK